MSQPYPYPPHSPQPGAYGPQGPHGPPQQPRAGVELKAWYAPPIVVLLVLGGVLLALAMFQLFDTATAAPPPPPAVSACTDQVSGLHLACKDVHGRKLAWTAQLAAKYRIEVAAPAPHNVSVYQGAARVNAIAGKAGTTTLLVDLDPADYTIRVEDPPGTVADKGYVLRVDWVAKKGEPPGELSSGGGLKAEFWASLIAALVCFAMAPLPLLLKRGVPLRLDPNGLTMRDGRTYPWNEFQGLRYVSRRYRGATLEFSAVLSFRTGHAEIIYGRVKNLYQVKPILEALAQGRNPWA